MIRLKNASSNLALALEQASEMAEGTRDEFLTPEHLLLAITGQTQFVIAMGEKDPSALLSVFLSTHIPHVPAKFNYDGVEPSEQFREMINVAFMQAQYAGVHEIDVPHVIQAMLQLDDSYARMVLEQLCHADDPEIMATLIEEYGGAGEPDFDSDGQQPQEQENQTWMEFVTCLNDVVDSHNPLIGREEELERTIQVLCRKDKNNPLHVGEPGVGKTALAYGLAAKIERGEVPGRLQGSRIYELNLGSLIAGTQYRGDFEKRLKLVLKGVSRREGNILYLDEIHNIVGAGSISGGSLDASNLLKPYLEEGKLRFMGATTYEEYNRNLLRNRGFARRFEKIDIGEPTVEQCQLILRGLKDNYEQFHHVHYTPEAIDYAATASSRYITGRFLPDKAIDLVDEAGAWRELHPEPGREQQVVDRQLMSQVLAHICHVDTLAEDTDDAARLEHLEEHLKSQIYGQDQAVREVTEAVLMGSAGLIDDHKPLASLLFVGPTGVGKTEIARVLAQELALPLVRFDMSEYAEKHTVAKLIGSPAGYVGYDDGGLLTDAIRKTPHCVLLFDELEKAHQDIYNILLQVMDYAVLTDNKGQKADFRHVIFIMTTNAGAQYARQGGVGFVSGHSAGQTMMKTVKQTFKPEFLNRLTAITVFNDMDRHMAALILDKKLRLLNGQLAQKHVTLTLTPQAHDRLLADGFSAEYGGREIDRVITSELKPLLMRAMLFGSLKGGGQATIDVEDGKMILKQGEA